MIEDLVRRFDERRIPRPEWTHAAHLAVGLWHVRTLEQAEALSRLRTGIRQLNEAHGNQNTAEGGYHETITCAYVWLLAEFLKPYAADDSTDRIVVELLSSALVDRDVLLAFYSREVLFSPAARLNWIEPDRAPFNALDNGS